MKNFLKRNRRKIAGVVVLIIAGALIYSYASKKSDTVKGPQALAIESKGLAEFDAGNDTSNNVSPQDKKLAEEIMSIFKEMGDGKDIKKNKQAAVSLGQIISKYPEYSDAYFLRAIVYISAGEQDYQEILSDIDNAIKFHSSEKFKSSYDSTAGMYSLRAKVDMLADNYQQAINDLETAIKIDPSKASGVLNTGGVKPEDDSNPTALQKKDLDLLIAKYPDDHRTFMFRGLFYKAFSFFNTQYYTPAISDLKKAIEIDQNSALAYYFLGSIYQDIAFNTYAFKINGGRTADYDRQRDSANAKALEYFNQAVKFDQNSAEIYAQIAESFYSLQKYSQAIPYYDKVVELQPENAGAYNDRGLAKTYINDYYDAISDFSKSIELKKSNPNISLGLDSTYENRAAAYLKTTNYDNVVQDYSSAIGLKFASQVFLMSIPQIRAIYPEFKNITDQDLLEGLRQKYFSSFSSANFAENYKEDKKPYKEFILGDLYASRGDVYLLSGNFKNAAKDYARATYEGSISILNRWRVISKTLDTEYYLDAQTLSFGSGNVSLWVKILENKNRTYFQSNFQINCAERKIKSVSVTNYNSIGNVLGTIPTQDWENIVPDTIGETLYKGMCK